MKALGSLIQAVAKYFFLHPPRQKTLVRVILGAMSTNNCQHHSLARHVGSHTKQAALRKVERFFQQEEMGLSLYSLIDRENKIVELKSSTQSVL